MTELETIAKTLFIEGAEARGASDYEERKRRAVTSAMKKMTDALEALIPAEKAYPLADTQDPPKYKLMVKWLFKVAECQGYNSALRDMRSKSKLGLGVSHEQ